jgi:SulP family sulfate permease
VIVMLTCFTLTVVFDMVIAVTVGVVLAALLFMRRMSVLTKAELETPTHLDVEVPSGVRIYDIAGPLFFGAAKSAMEALHTVGDRDHTYILDMQHVPTIDATGLVALESVLDRLHRSKIKIIFAGLSTEMSNLFARAGIKRELGKVAYAPDVETAIGMAIVHARRIGRRVERSSPSMRLPAAASDSPQTPAA